LAKYGEHPHETYYKSLM